MYIRKASRTVHAKTYFNYLLVESHLTPKGPRQKVICSLGDLSPRPKEQWLELARKLENALTGQQDLFASASPDPELETLVAKVKAGPRRRRAQRAIARGRAGPRGLPVLAAAGDRCDSAGSGPG